MPAGSPGAAPAPARAVERVRVDGRDVEVVVDTRLLDETLLPALEGVARRQGAEAPEDRADRPVRDLVFLAAPPGTGKSTLAALLERRAARRGLDLAVVGLDGFHLPQAELEARSVVRDGRRVPLSAIKGAPETFDLAGLTRHLDRARTRAVPWARYDRVLHDVVPGDRPVDAGLVLLEGNYLLLDEPGWAELSSYAAFCIFLEADPDLLRHRLVDRKVRGGLSRAEAEDFYERSDRHNVARVLERSDRGKADLVVRLDLPERP